MREITIWKLCSGKQTWVTCNGIPSHPAKARVLTWRHGSHIGVPKQLIDSHLGVPKCWIQWELNSFLNVNTFFCSTNLCMTASHISENTQYTRQGFGKIRCLSQANTYRVSLGKKCKMQAFLCFANFFDSVCCKGLQGKGQKTNSDCLVRVETMPFYTPVSWSTVVTSVDSVWGCECIFAGDSYLVHYRYLSSSQYQIGHINSHVQVPSKQSFNNYFWSS